MTGILVLVSVHLASFDGKGCATGLRFYDIPAVPTNCMTPQDCPQGGVIAGTVEVRTCPFASYLEGRKDWDPTGNQRRGNVQGGMQLM